MDICYMMHDFKLFWTPTDTHLTLYAIHSTKHFKTLFKKWSNQKPTKILHINALTLTNGIFEEHQMWPTIFVR
jgi:hypothetical protein